MSPVIPPPPVLIAVNKAALARQLIRLTRQSLPGVRIKLARNGRQALDACLAHKPALLIANVALPTLASVNVLKSLRQTRDLAKLPVILLSGKPDAALVRALSPLSPSAILSLPLSEERLSKLLQMHLADQQPLDANLTLSAFLESERKTVADLSGLRGVRRALADCLSRDQHLGLLRQRCEHDRALYERLVEHAARSTKEPCPTLEQIVSQLGLARCFSLALEMQLEDSTELSDSRLTDCLKPFLEKSRQAAELAAWLAHRLGMAPAQCYLGGLLLHLGEFALAHSLQRWQRGRGELGTEELLHTMQQHAASFGSALRIGWRLPIPLRECVAGFYGLRAGVHSRETLIFNLTGKLMTLDGHSPLSLLEERTVRMLGVGPLLLQAIPQQQREPVAQAAG